MNDAVPREGSERQPPPSAEHAGPAAEDTTPRTAPGYTPAAPAPLDVPRAPTGNVEVDAWVARLSDADHLATDGHVEVYEDVHRGLRDALTALDARPVPPGPARRPAAAPRRGPSGHESDPTHRQGS
ncbi:hypothetical protein [Streptomyces prasinopilosus]|uniref:Uncharacterized protein n=1 Tax=Streptomyces prasinopilosus TaxID=67344 RepID=A0A1G6UN90_9ACTN|nr:hypothetical protein [Streptomyces prasinopilosus]SDD42812.1 hypothetical protein SAMN05216505_107260 [Streptomyces prasinopilosus]